MLADSSLTPREIHEQIEARFGADSVLMLQRALLRGLIEENVHATCKVRMCPAFVCESMRTSSQHAMRAHVTWT